MTNTIQLLIAIFFCINATLAFGLVLLYLQEDKPKSKINHYVYYILISSIIWSSGMGLMSIQNDDNLAYFFRVFGIMGTFIFMISVQFSLCALADLSTKVKNIFNGISLLGIPVFFAYILPGQTVFIHNWIGTTFYFRQGLINTIYSLYFTVVSINFMIVIIHMINHSNLQRTKVAGKRFVIVASCIFVGAITDMIMPAFGFPALPGSALTHFFGVLVFWVAIHEMYRSQLTFSNMSEYVYRSLDTPVMIFNTDYKLEIMNDASTTFFQIDKSEFVSDVLEISSLFEASNDIFCFAERSSLSKAVCHSTKANCEIFISKILDSYNDIIGYICLVNDLTEHELVVSELEKAKLAADAANLSKSLFLANMSHEIRTPMNAILGFSELALSEQPDEKSKEYFSEIKQAGDILLTVINEILDISKIELGKYEITNENYKPASIIRDVELITQSNAQKKGLQLHTIIDSDFPEELYGDKNKIREILLNILGNAVKYTKTGSIEFRGGAIRQSDTSALIRFEIKDTGIGIKPEDINTIFDKFSRVDAKLNSTTEGTGLGLSITKGMVEILHGTITVQSEYGKGSTFIVEIPQTIVDAKPIQMNPSAATEIQDNKFPDRLPLENYQILVVDDSTVNLKVSSGFLKKLGGQIETSSSGMDSIEKCKNKLYDIVFMDHMMPEMDGVEAMKNIRQIPGYEAGSQHKIVVLTANAVNDARTALLAEGFDDFLSKPISKVELLKIVDRMLS